MRREREEESKRTPLYNFMITAQYKASGIGGRAAERGTERGAKKKGKRERKRKIERQRKSARERAVALPT